MLPTDTTHTARNSRMTGGAIAVVSMISVSAIARRAAVVSGRVWAGAVAVIDTRARATSAGVRRAQRELSTTETRPRPRVFRRNTATPARRAEARRPTRPDAAPDGRRSDGEVSYCL